MGLIDSGVAVLGSTLGALDGMSILGKQAGSINAWLAGSALGQAAGRVGMHYAATGGELTKGILVFKLPDQNGTMTWKTFTFPINPEELTERLQPEYAVTKVPGQNNAWYQFVNGGERELSFSLHFFYVPEKRGFITGQLDVLRQLVRRQFVDAATVNANAAPPAVYLYFGKHIRGERFIVSDLNIKCFDLFDPAFLLPMRATVEVTLKESVDLTAQAPDNQVTLGNTTGSLSSILKAAL